LNYLGILPMRDDPEAGVEVRYVFPQSPADKAGITAGDRLLKITVGANSAAFNGRDQLTDLLAKIPAGAEIKLEVRPKEAKESKELTFKLEEMKDDLPAKLPSPSSAKKA